MPIFEILIPLETGFWDPPIVVLKFLGKILLGMLFVALVFAGIALVFRIICFFFKIILILTPLWLGALSIYWGYNFNWWFFWIFFPISILILIIIYNWVKEEGIESLGNWLSRCIID